MTPKSLILPSAAAIVVAVVALAFSQSRGGSTPASSGAAAGGAVTAGKTARLRIANYAFSPAALTVKSGATITVKNTDSTAHTATSGSGAFDSGTLKPGQSAQFTVTKPGTYSYICSFHAFMAGTVKVVG